MSNYIVIIKTAKSTIEEKVISKNIKTAVTHIDKFINNVKEIWPDWESARIVNIKEIQ